MTEGLQTLNPEKEQKRLFKIHIKEKHIVFLCIVSLVAAEENIWLCALPVIFILLCKERAGGYICSAAVVIYYAATLITSSFYIPYIVFVLFRLVADYLLPGGKIKPVYPAAAVFILAKGYVLTFGYGTEYYFATALEVAALLFLPDIVRDGIKLLKDDINIITSLQLAETAAAIITAALALSGINVWGINFPASFLLGISFYYSVKNNMPVSMLGTLCAVLTFYGSGNFTYLFAGFLIIGFGSFALLQKGSAGYAGTLLVSLAVTVAFITYFNSFIFLTTTALSLAVCFCFSKAGRTVKSIPYSETRLEKDYIRLKNEIEKLTRTFSFLGHTVIDISSLMGENTVPGEAGDMVAGEVCKNCSENTLCWQQHYSHTQNQFAACCTALQKNKNFAFDNLFLSRCNKTDTIMQSFEAANRLVTTQRLISVAGRHNQKILQNQFLAMAKILQDIVYRHSRSGMVNTACTHNINNLLAAMGKRVNYVVCYQNPGSCVVDCPDYLAPAEQEKIRVKLESIYNVRFNGAVKEEQSESVLYTYSETAEYTLEFACKSASRHNNCGDVCDSFESENFRYVIVADGMGTGSFAAAESRTALAMLKSLLTAKVSPQTALDITNTALNLKGTGQSCVAVDILRIDCHSGEGQLFKAGGAGSLVIQAGRVAKLEEDGLPIGILKDTKAVRSDFNLSNGYTVILMSDGIKADKALLQRVQLISASADCEKLAHNIVNHHSTDDDATVAAVKLVRT